MTLEPLGHWWICLVWNFINYFGMLRVMGSTNNEGKLTPNLNFFGLLRFSRIETWNRVGVLRNYTVSSGSNHDHFALLLIFARFRLKFNRPKISLWITIKRSTSEIWKRFLLDGIKMLELWKKLYWRNDAKVLWQMQRTPKGWEKGIAQV